jgi:hypothetical protein
MHALLSVPSGLEDTLELLAGHLTREEAGRLLLPLCRAAAAFVRGADAAKDGGGPDIWAEVAPWDLRLTRARIAAAYVKKPHRRLHVYVLSALALEVEKMRRAGVVQPVFDRASDAPASILGCHKLVVLLPYEFYNTMLQWIRGFLGSWLRSNWEFLADETMRCWVARHIRVYTQNKTAKDEVDTILGVLSEAGLHRRRKDRALPYPTMRDRWWEEPTMTSEKITALCKGPKPQKGQLLWQKAYWAHGY